MMLDEKKEMWSSLFFFSLPGTLSKAEHLAALRPQLDLREYDLPQRFQDHVRITRSSQAVCTFTRPYMVVPGWD